MSMHDSEERPYGDDVSEDVAELRRLSAAVVEARETLGSVEDDLKRHLTEIDHRLRATEAARNVEYDYSHPDMAYADVLVRTALVDPSAPNVDALAEEMSEQAMEWSCRQRNYDDDDYDDREEHEHIETLGIPRNPFSVLGAQDTWGKVVVRFHNGVTACVSCGATQTITRPIVPPNLLPPSATPFMSNWQPLCAPCSTRWDALPVEAHVLAAALLVRGFPEPLPSVPLSRLIGIGGTDLYTRDGGQCRVCGFSSDDPKAFHRGHILSKHDGRDRKDGAVWGLPLALTESPLNYVLLCPPCNEAMGPVSPYLRVGLRFLLKPWTDDPSGIRLVEARKARIQERSAALRADRLRRAFGT